MTNIFKQFIWNLTNVADYKSGFFDGIIFGVLATGLGILLGNLFPLM